MRSFGVLDIPARIEAWRSWLGMSKGELSEASGVGRDLVWKWRKGHVNPTLTSVAKILGALDITIQELLGETPGEVRRGSHDVAAAVPAEGNAACPEETR